MNEFRTAKFHSPICRIRSCTKRERNRRLQYRGARGPDAPGHRHRGHFVVRKCARRRSTRNGTENTERRENLKLRLEKKKKSTKQNMVAFEFRVIKRRGDGTADWAR